MSEYFSVDRRSILAVFNVFSEKWSYLSGASVSIRVSVILQLKQFNSVFSATKMINISGSLALGFCLVMASLVLSQEPIQISLGDANSVPKQPQSTIDVDGKLHVVYGDGDAVFYCRSIDNGKSFTLPSQAFRVPNMSLGMRRGPRIAISNGMIVVTAIGGAQGKGRDGDIQAWNSRDGGTSWHGPFLVNDQVSSAREGLHAMCSADDGTLWCVWLDLRNKRSEIYASKSSDSGSHGDLPWQN